MNKLILSIFLVSLTNFSLGCVKNMDCVDKARCNYNPRLHDGTCEPIDRSCTPNDSSNCPDGYECKGTGPAKDLHYQCDNKKCSSNSDCGKAKCLGMGIYKNCFAEKVILATEETELIEDMYEESGNYSEFTMIMGGLFGLVVGAVIMRLMSMRNMAKPERYSEMNHLVAMQN